jgi:hypothetical protein
MFQSTEEHRVLALSLVLAVFSAYSTLKLAGRLPRKHRGRRVWCLATGIVLIAGALAAARLAKEGRHVGLDFWALDENLENYAYYAAL